MTPLESALCDVALARLRAYELWRLERPVAPYDQWPLSPAVMEESP